MPRIIITTKGKTLVRREKLVPKKPKGTAPKKRKATTRRRKKISK